MPHALYTLHNVTPAFQLRWSLALFTTQQLPPLEVWLEPLKEVVQKDNVRILESKCLPPNVWLFLLTTTPSVSPSDCVKSVKGRLQHLIRSSSPSAFRRNFSLTSLGDASRNVIEEYVANQLGHHRIVDERVQQRLFRFQLVFPEVDLSQPLFSSHGRYVFNLHLVVVNSARWHEIREDVWATTRDMFVSAATRKGHRLSRLSIQPDHLHATLGCNLNELPQEVALSYMNNLAYAHGMKDVLQYSYYVGTFGEYDMQAVRRSLSDR
jgi:REP element-mobilizing transposase RayT